MLLDLFSFCYKCEATHAQCVSQWSLWLEHVKKNTKKAPNFTNTMNFVFCTILIITRDYFHAQHGQFVCITEAVCVYCTVHTVYLYVV